MKVFIVHGRGKVPTLELRGFLSQLGLEPVILQEQDDLGLTIIEKFEHYAKPCKAAFIVMTPDDKLTAHSSSSDVKAARQNVMIELGWFMCHLGRKRVIILHQSGTEVPSNIAGVLYLHFEGTVLEVSEKIRTRLKGLGLLQES